MEMLNQGSVLHLAGMGIVFLLMILLILRLGKGVSAKQALEKEEPHVSFAPAKTNDAVTAAITAAINEYRKNN